MTDYILFMFGEHKQQDLFIELIANEINVIAQSKNIKYYYGHSSAIFTFKTNESLNEINDFLTIIFGSSNVVYVLLPFSTENLSFQLPEGIYEHLFDIDNDDTMSGFTTTELFIDEMNETTDNIEYNGDLFTHGYFDDMMLNSKKPEPTIDDILDKISEKGLSSLSEKEKSILDKYSKTV